MNATPYFQYATSLTDIVEDVPTHDVEDLNMGEPPNWGEDAFALAEASGFVDPDGYLTRIAISANGADPLTEGRWQYSVDIEGKYWHDVGPVSPSQALVLVVGNGVTTYLRFAPAADFAGTPGALTVHAIDDSGEGMGYTIDDGQGGVERYTIDIGAAGEGGPVSPNGVEWKIKVLPVNDKPAILDLGLADSHPVVAGTGPTLLDTGAAATVLDPDQEGLAGGHLSVTFASGYQPGDLLGIQASPRVTLSSGITPGSEISVDGVAIGIISDGPGLDIFLDGDASAARVSTLLRHLSFDASGQGSGARTLHLSLEDGMGAKAELAATTITVVTRPTLAISSDAESLKAGETATLTLRFSAQAPDFDLGDLSVSGGTLSALTPTADPLEFRVLFTPDAEVQDVQAAISVAADKFHDGSGQGNAASVAPTLIALDTLAPAVTAAKVLVTGATGNAGAFRSGDTVNVSWDGEANSDIASVDIDFSALGGNPAVAATYAHGVWSASWQIGAGAIDAADLVLNLSARDAAGNLSTRAAALKLAVDNQAPVVGEEAIVVVGAGSGPGGAYRIGDTVTVSWQAGDQADIAAVEADFSQFGAGAKVAAQLVDGAWTASYVIQAAQLGAGPHDVGLSVTDDAGNAKDGFTSAGLVVDAAAPAVTAIALVGTPGPEATSISFRVSLSEPVTGLDASDFVLTASGAASGRIAAVTDLGDGIAEVTVDQVTGNGSLRLDLKASGTGIADLGLNPIAGGYTSGAVHLTGFNAAPAISSNGGLDQATVEVAERQAAVTTVAASDADQHALSYTIVGGADAELFSIDAASGALAFKQAPAWSDVQGADNAYEVKVAVSDGHGGSDSQLLTVQLVRAPAVENPAPQNPAPAPVSSTVDGVTLVTGTRRNADGSTSQVIEVPVVSAGREEVIGQNTVADIPLASAGGNSLLTAQLPTGLGLHASGQATPGTAGGSLADLIREIKAHTAEGSSDQNLLVGGGSGFLGGLDAATPLLVQSIVPTVAAGSAAGAEPLVLRAQPVGADGVQTALVIDARGLPQGIHLQLQDVAFAAVIGAARVTGGDGAQKVWGDSASQTIVLGADDDVLHGGAGDDTVGSAGGDDQIYGDEGNDTVFGGAGNDLVDGGSGVDTVLLAGATRADYSLRVEQGVLRMAARSGTDGSDTVANVEVLQFAGPDLSAQGSIGRLYESVLGRAADTAGREFWLARHDDGMALETIAGAIVGSSEALQAQQAHAGYVAELYRNVFGREGDAEGLAFWTAQLDGGNLSRAGLALELVGSQEKLAMPSSAQLDVNHSELGTLVRMYEALLDRRPDEGGLNFWLAAHEAGMSMSTLAQHFLAASEPAARYASLSDAEFVAEVYQTALGHAPGASEAADWSLKLASGQVTRGDVLLGVADSAEMADLVGVVSTSIQTV